MLRLRIITAIVLVAVLVGALVMGARAFIALAGVIFGVALFEWLRLAAWPAGGAVAGGVLLALGLIALEWSGVAIAPAVLVAIAALACASWFLVACTIVYAERSGRLHLHNGVVAGLAPLLLAGAWFSMIALYRRGAVFLFSALAVVWIADIAAYFAGRAFGRRKLAPHISPGKTWAGAVGAIVAVLLVGAGLWMAWPEGALFSNTLFARNAALALVLLAVLVVVSIVGDLFESLLKRHAGVKDSSSLLPGHGGVLDRIDALLSVLPAAVLIEAWL
jgi:phosphatidate cytidylyltransferase